MPGVRYGPDIADDAAFIMNNLVTLNKRQRDLEKKGKTLGKADSSLQNKMAKLADGLFGVSRADIDQNKFGEMGQLAQYSSYGRSARGKAYKRSKMARNARTGKIRQREVAAEHKRRGADRGITQDASGGASYLGRTQTKKYTRLRDQAAQRAATNKLEIGRARVRGTNPEQIDNLGIARTGGSRVSTPGALGKNPNPLSKTGSLRPPKRASVSRRTQGGRGGPKKPAGPKKPTKPKTPRTKKK